MENLVVLPTTRSSDRTLGAWVHRNDLKTGLTKEFGNEGNFMLRTFKDLRCRSYIQSGGGVNVGSEHLHSIAPR